MMTPKIHDEPTNGHGEGCVGAHGDKEECSILKLTVRKYIEKDGEAGDRDADGDDGKKEAVS